MTPTDLKECAWLIVDGCFHDYLCAIKYTDYKNGVVLCAAHCENCPDFTPKDKPKTEK